MASAAKKKLVVCGGTGFLGTQSLLRVFSKHAEAPTCSHHHRKPHLQSCRPPRLGRNIHIVRLPPNILQLTQPTFLQTLRRAPMVQHNLLPHCPTVVILGLLGKGRHTGPLHIHLAPRQRRCSRALNGHTPRSRLQRRRVGAQVTHRGAAARIQQEQAGHAESARGARRGGTEADGEGRTAYV
jgi:hypothetical protein